MTTVESELIDALEDIREASDGTATDLIAAVLRGFPVVLAAVDRADPGVGEELLAGIATQARRLMQPRARPAEGEV